MKTSLRIEPGHQFEISVDPANPKRNTASEFLATWLGRTILWVIGLAIGSVAAYLNNR